MNRRTARFLSAILAAGGLSLFPLPRVPAVESGMVLQVPKFGRNETDRPIRSANDRRARDSGPCPCDADLNDDGEVGVSDLTLLLACDGDPPIGDCEAADINCDGLIDGCDIVILNCQWGNGDPQCCDTVTCGACCAGDGECTHTEELLCENDGFLFLGPNTSCVDCGCDVGVAFSFLSSNSSCSDQIGGPLFFCQGDVQTVYLCFYAGEDGVGTPTTVNWQLSGFDPFEYGVSPFSGSVLIPEQAGDPEAIVQIDIENFEPADPTVLILSYTANSVVPGVCSGSNSEAATLDLVVRPMIVTFGDQDFESGDTRPVAATITNPCPDEVTGDWEVSEQDGNHYDNPTGPFGPLAENETVSFDIDVMNVAPHMAPVMLRLTATPQVEAGPGYGEGTMQFEPPIITNIEAQYFRGVPTETDQKHVLYQDLISLSEDIAVTVDWRNHQAETVQYKIEPGTEYNVPQAGGGVMTATRQFNMSFDFDAGDKLKVRALSADGTESQFEPALFDVISLPLGIGNVLTHDSESEEELVYIGEVPLADGTINIVGVGSPGTLSVEFPGFSDSPIGTVLSMLPTGEVTGEGIATLNLGSVGGDNEEDEEEDDDEEEDGDSDLGGGVSYSWDIGLSAMWLYSNGWDFDGGTISAGAQVSTSIPKAPVQFFIPVGPVVIPGYVEGSIAFDAELDLVIDDFSSHSGPPDLSGTITLTPSAEIMLGVGVKMAKIFLEAYFGGGFTFGVQYPAEEPITEMRVFMAGGLRAAAWIFSYEVEALACVFDIVSDTGGCSSRLIASSFDWHLAPRDYLGPDYAVFMGGSDRSISSTHSLTIVQSNVFPQSNPSITAASGDLFLAWIYDQPGRASADRTMVKYSKFDGMTWSPPANVTPGICSEDAVSCTDDGDCASNACGAGDLCNVSSGSCIDDSDCPINYCNNAGSCSEDAVACMDDSDCASNTCGARDLCNVSSGSCIDDSDCPINYCNNDGTADFAVDIAGMSMGSCDGDVIAVWENANSTIIVDPNCQETACLDDVADMLEIATSYYDSSAGTWGSQSTLTANGEVGKVPLVDAGSDCTAMATWLDTTSSGDAPLRRPYYSIFNGSSWSAPATITTEFSTGDEIISYDLAFTSVGGTSSAVIVYSVDEDGNDTSLGDREIHAQHYDNGTWSAVGRLTNNTCVEDHKPQVSVDESGNFVMVWYRGEQPIPCNSSPIKPLDGDLKSSVLTLSSGNPPQLGPVTTIIDRSKASSRLADFYLSRGPGGALAAVWQAPNQQLVDLNYAWFDPNTDTWSKERTLTDDREMEHSVAGVVDQDGSLVLAFNHVQIVDQNRDITFDDGTVFTVQDVPTPGQSNLVVARHQPALDVGVGPAKITVDPANPMPGETVTICGQVKNFGDVPVSNLQVGFYIGGTVIDSVQEIAGPLVGGEVVGACVPFDVPGSPVPIDLFMVIDPNEAIAEADETNNTVIKPYLKPDLVVAEMWVTQDDECSRNIYMKVGNVGASATTQDVELSLRALAIDGEILETFTIAPLPPGQVAPLEWYHWPNPSEGTAGLLLAFANVDEADNLDEFNDNNNTRFTQVNMNTLGDQDCQPNGVADSCDIASGNSDDTNGDGVPDECSPPCTGDIDGDGQVGAFDLALLLGSWGPCDGCPADFNEDDVVDAFDLAQLLGAWGMCP